VARPGPSKRGRLHVGRYFGVLLLLLALLYAGVVFGGTGGKPLTPKLALDLRGGASVILQANGTKGQRPTATQLDTAVAIISKRVNGAGVSEAEVVTEGDNIVVSVPGGNRGNIANVTKTAQLRFREVLNSQPSQPSRLPVPPTAPTPKAAPTPAPGKVAPKATSVPTTPRKRPITAGLLAAPSPAPSSPLKTTAPRPAAPKAATTPAAPATTAPAAPAPTAAGGPLVHTGDLFTPQSFAALDCTNPKARQSGVIEDDPDKQIVACSSDGGEKYQLDVAKVRGSDVKGATVGTDSSGIGIVVNVQFTGSGQDKFTELTRKTAPTMTRVAVVLDGLVESAPAIQSVIQSDAQISGRFTQKEAQALANDLKYGALPLTFRAGDTQVLSASLGGDQLHSGLLAGGLGLLAVVVYSLLYYRALGLVTIASLLTSAALTYAMVSLLGKEIGFALSLAGIAGFIVAVGITADSFVVYFERLKDEIKEGRTPRSAVDRAWVRARRTILSADTVSFLAAVILYFVSVGGVRGFAFTLGLSTVLDIVVVFLFTRPLISYLSRFRWFSRSRLTGFFGPEGGQPSTGGPRRGLSGTAAAQPVPAGAGSSRVVPTSREA
jgi:preprotein translocase subunit SecD